MNQQERTKRLTTGMGRKLSDFLRGALVDPRDLPGKAELRVRIAEEFGDVEGIDPEALFDAFVEFAQKGQNPTKRWELVQHAQEVALQVSTRLDEVDRLVGPDGTSDEDVTRAVEHASDKYLDRAGGELARRADQERAAAQELLRKAGIVRKAGR